MQFQNLIYTKENGVAKAVLNRPEALNALNVDLRSDLVAAITDVRDDAEVRALVITGAGRAFSAGGDINTLRAIEGATAWRDRIQTNSRNIVVALANLEKPVIGLINGPAVGAGCGLALACDILIASEDAKFAQAFVKVGAIPDLGSIFHLPRAVGLHKAKELVFTGDTIDAQTAERIGMVSKVVPAAELETAGMALAQRLAQMPTKAIGMAKVLMQRALSTDLGGAIELEALGQAVCAQTKDFREGLDAFIEKRKPVFRGE